MKQVRRPAQSLCVGRITVRKSCRVRPSSTAMGGAHTIPNLNPTMNRLRAAVVPPEADAGQAHAMRPEGLPPMGDRRMLQSHDVPFFGPHMVLNDTVRGRLAMRVVYSANLPSTWLVRKHSATRGKLRTLNGHTGDVTSPNRTTLSVPSVHADQRRRTARAGVAHAGPQTVRHHGRPTRIRSSQSR